MTEDLIKTLLYKSEGDTLDFKRDQYPLAGADNETKSELVKDIVAFANAWKTADAHILIGVDENPGDKAIVVGITDHLEDANLQLLVNSKAIRPVRFHYSAVAVEGKQIGVITIGLNQDRPLYLKKDFGKLRKDVVYVRRGSSTVEAGPDEIAEMGKARAEAAIAVPSMSVEFADPNARRSLGTSIERVSVILVDPPRPPATPLADAQAKIVAAFLNQEETRQGLMAMADFSKSIDFSARFRPKPQEVRRYHEELARFHSVGVVIRNTGSVPATGVRLEIFGQRIAGFEVRDVCDAPEEPSGLPRIHPISFRSSVSVSLHDDEWRAVVEVGNLQPKAEHWTDADLYIAATLPVNVQATARIYADNLAQPVEIPVDIRLQTVEKTYQPSQQEED